MARHHRGAEVWRVALVVGDAAGADAAVAALGTICGAVSAFEQAPGGHWLVEGYAERAPEHAMIEMALALLWLERGGAALVPSIERVPPRDWLAENQASFSPLAAGRYFVHGSHYRDGAPAGRIALVIDAATAFGSGEHASTRGCLLALDGLARTGRRPRVLDMGTGTGILAIAAAKTWRRMVLARDIDREAVRVAARNAAMNGVAAAVEVAQSNGYRGLRRGRGFDLVLANILARPLGLMAPALARALAPGGVAVLSGLLARQERAVLAAHRLQRLHLRRRVAIDGWHTLVLARRGC
ncbi:MAG TPA: 50S ribosomal protein L11 methyltransferase [Stellaceae bacterium]|nr:50S ribosomal protein L11 methyltransferase [Stellaceae bacterium]